MESFESFFESYNKKPEQYQGKLKYSEGRILDYRFEVESRKNANPDDLSICGSCASDLVYPVDWEEAGPTHWEVSLRCPNCEWTGTGVFEQQAIEGFDEVLDRGTEALVRDLKSMMHANFEDEIERFVDALNDDHIVPEDF